MVSVQSPPGGRELPYARVLLLPAILMAAVTGAAVAVVTSPARTAVGWCGGIATLLVIAVAAEAVRRGRVIRGVRAELAGRTTYLEQRIAAHDQDIVRFHEEVLPAAIKRMNGGVNPDAVARAFGLGDPGRPQISQAQRDLLCTFLKLLDTEKLLLDSSHRSFVNIARRVQAIVHQQNKELREMEEDHGRNPEVFDDLLRIDHGTALIGRLADSIAVLGGGRPGRNWPEPVPLFSVMRGAMSRILEYRRIELHSIADVAVNGIHVEPVIHAVAELLDNATRYSPPNSKVHLTALKVQTGVAIEIEDSGVSFSDEARGKMEELLRQAAAGTDLQVLGEAPGSASPSWAGCRRCTTCRSRSGSPRTAVSARSSWCRATCSPRTPPRSRARRRRELRRDHGHRRGRGAQPQAEEAPPDHRTPPPRTGRRIPGGRRPRGHRVDRQRPAAAAQQGQDPAQPAVRRGRPGRRGGSGGRGRGALLGRRARRPEGGEAATGDVGRGVHGRPQGRP